MALGPFDWQSLKPQPIIGVDEVGRGCLAGPVYAAACILDESKPFDLYTDSKKLTPNKREMLAEHIQTHHRVVVAWASVEEIDRLNILQAALLAMRRAVEGLGVGSGHVVVDGTFSIPGLLKAFLQTPLIKGDFRASPVAAASIVAKVARDAWITSLDQDFPQYEFGKHKGYSTEIHKQAIEAHGPCVHHRRSFSGVKEYF
jgi:ribonuclease HII